MRIHAFSILATLVLALTSAGASEEEAKNFQILVDPRLNAAELPPSPSPADRIALLAALAQLPACGNAHHHAEWMQTVFDTLERVPSRSDRIDAIAHIVLTERAASMSQINMAVEYLASRRTPKSDAWVLQIYRNAPIVARRLMPAALDAELVPMAENSNAIDIRASALRAALDSGNRILATTLQRLDPATGAAR